MLLLNVPPNRQALIEASYVAVLQRCVQGINDMFKIPLPKTCDVAGSCDSPTEVTAPAGARLDCVVTKEDLRHGQRMLNYTIEYHDVSGTAWQSLIQLHPWEPTGLPRPPHFQVQCPEGCKLSTKRNGIQDITSTNYTKDSRVSLTRMDLQIHRMNIMKLRFRCLETRAGTIYIKSVS